MSRYVKLGNTRPKSYERSDLGDDPVLKKDQPRLDDCFTEIHISPDSTDEQAIQEIKTCWSVASWEKTPTSIQGRPREFVLKVMESFNIKLEETQ